MFSDLLVVAARQFDVSLVFPFVALELTALRPGLTMDVDQRNFYVSSLLVF